MYKEYTQVNISAQIAKENLISLKKSAKPIPYKISSSTCDQFSNSKINILTLLYILSSVFKFRYLHFHLTKTKTEKTFQMTEEL